MAELSSSLRVAGPAARPGPAPAARIDRAPGVGDAGADAFPPNGRMYRAILVASFVGLFLLALPAAGLALWAHGRRAITFSG